MTNKEAIIYAKGMLECGGNVKRQDFLETAIDALEKIERIIDGIEDLYDTLNDAYTLNDYLLDKVIRWKLMTECENIAESFSLKVMQNLSWLLGVIDWSEE